jgi:mono/diheme cytochrome c family protein
MRKLRLLLVFLLLLCPTVAPALVSEGRPGIPYFNHVFFLDQKVVEGGVVTWVTLAYVDTREQALECRNKIDVFAGKELFAEVPAKSWILVDYELQSILVEEGFIGDADVFKVTRCTDVDACCALRDRLNADPEQAARQARHTRPAKTKAVRLGDIEDQLETGRQLVKSARCRGCHSIEGFGAAHAPSLTWKRYKYEKGWLEAYLRAPYRLRPAMTDLMMLKFTSPNAQPSLQPVEADAVADYLAKVAWTKAPAARFRGEPWAGYDCYDCHRKLYREEPLVFVPTPVPAPLRERLDTSAVLQSCLACHAFGDYRQHPAASGQQSPFVFAPDLLLAMEKLETNYFVSYVRDPDYLQPGATMPKLGLGEKPLEELKSLVLAVKKAIAGGELRPVHNYYEM